MICLAQNVLTWTDSPGKSIGANWNGVIFSHIFTGWERTAKTSSLKDLHSFSDGAYAHTVRPITVAEHICSYKKSIYVGFHSSASFPYTLVNLYIMLHSIIHAKQGTETPIKTWAQSISGCEVNVRRRSAACTPSLTLSLSEQHAPVKSVRTTSSPSSAE